MPPFPHALHHVIHARPSAITTPFEQESSSWAILQAACTAPTNRQQTPPLPDTACFTDHRTWFHGPPNGCMFCLTSKITHVHAYAPHCWLGPHGGWTYPGFFHLPVLCVSIVAQKLQLWMAQIALSGRSGHHTNGASTAYHSTWPTCTDMHSLASIPCMLLWACQSDTTIVIYWY